MRERVSKDLPAGNELAWGKPTLTKGVTTILDNQFDKSGLLGWALGLALRELYGYYDFTNESGEHLFGFSKNVGSMWLHHDGKDGGEVTAELNQDQALNLIESAAKAYQRKKKSGADIGSLVHNAAEQYTRGTPFALTLEKYAEGQEWANPDEEALWRENAPEELRMAQAAFDQFVSWWKTVRPELVSAEELVYSRELDFCGTYDALLGIDGKLILVDYKTSNASKSAGAPEGVYPSYLAQSALYALAWEEMGHPPIDDLLILSVRKDGQFSAVYASQLGFNMKELKEWGKRLVENYVIANKVKKALIEQGKGE